MSEVDVRAFADEDCPVCDGAGYTDGVTVRHPCYNCNPAFELDRATDRLVEVGAVELEHAALPLDALGHQDDILAAFAAYDRLVRWEETREGSRLDATETIIERAQARGHIVALVANIAVAALQERLEAAEARLASIASVAVVRGRCVFCSHPDDPADGAHTSTCPVAPESDPCPYVHDSGDRCVLQFEHGGSHDLGY